MKTNHRTYEDEARKLEEIECEFDSIFMICLTVNSNPEEFFKR